jgi:UDP-glucose 4-epimerase
MATPGGVAMMKPVLIMGGAGFIGSHLVNRLIADGRAVRILDRIPADLPPAWSSAQVEYIAGDFMDHSAIDVAVNNVEVAFHLVSTTIPATSNVDPIFDAQSNLIGTLSFLRAAVQAGVKKIIFVSSGGTVYGKPVSLPIKETDPTDPLCSYGITKLAIEKYLAMFELLHGLTFVAFRLANPYGEGQRPGAQGAITAFMQKAATGKPLEIWGDGAIVRDYIYIHDAIDVLVRSIAYSGKHRIFNLGSGQGRSLNEIVDILRLVTGMPLACIYQEARAFDVPANVLDISRVKQEFDWAPGDDMVANLAKVWHRFVNGSGS